MATWKREYKIQWCKADLRRLLIKNCLSDGVGFHMARFSVEGLGIMVQGLEGCRGVGCVVESLGGFRVQDLKGSGFGVEGL